MANALVLKKISKTFGEFCALKNINANVPERKVTAFIGPNGAGKTTLFNIIAGMLKSDEGMVTMNGKDITGMPAYAIARLGLGRQFQDLRVFDTLTVVENLLVAALPHKSRDAWCAWRGSKQERKIVKQLKQKVMHWIEYVGLQDEKDNLARNLSFGQQKLLTIARLFAQDANILLLDEPTAGLSYKMMKQIVELIYKSVEEHGFTVALVEHNMSVVEDLSYWIHFMHEGKVAFSGKTAHVLGNQSVREIYMGL